MGQGTSFTFNTPVLPLDCADTNSQAARKVIGLAPGQPHFRLLVVEDNDTNRNPLVKLLRTAGFETKEAVNGLETVEVWRKWQPHIIWMDMRMPVMNGYEAIKNIKFEMQNANYETELSDALMIYRIIEEIRCTNGQSADELNELAKRFAYDRILSLIQEALSPAYGDLCALRSLRDPISRKLATV